MTTTPRRRVTAKTNPKTSESAVGEDTTSLPPGEMTQRDIERHWGRDRLSLVDCAARHAELNQYIVERDAGLTGR